MLEVPQIMDADAGYRKAFGQVRANRFHPLAQPRTELEQGWTVGRRHPFAWRGHHYYAVPFLQPRLAEGVDEAFIGGHETSKAFNQVVQQSDVMGPGREQGKVEDHPRAGDAQPQLEAIVIELFRGTMPIVCPWLETAVPATARVATDRQGQGINDLDRVGGLPTDVSQPLVDGGFHLPEVGGLPHEQRALGQTRKEVGIMRAKIRHEFLVSSQLKILPTNFHRDHFFVRQRRRKATPPQRVGALDPLVMLADQTIDSNDKLIAIHWGPPWAKSWCGNRYSTERLLNGSAT